MSDNNKHTIPTDDPFPSSSSYMSEPRGYALSGKIMLSAIIILFAVVIIMVCLHIYARWYILRARRRQVRRARRRTHLVFYIEPNNPSSIIPIPNRGLDPFVLSSLPVFIFDKKSHEDEVVDINDDDGKEGKDKGEGEEADLECTVCLSEFEHGEKVRPLPTCNHIFHVECIDMWFHSHSTCPICRAPVEASDFSAVAIAALGNNKPEGAATTTAEGRAVRGVNEPSRQISQPHQLTDPNNGNVNEEIMGPSPSSRRIKGMEFVGVSIELPPNRLHSFVDESGPSQAAKSPTSRILSFKRILSRDKKSSPLPSPSGVGPSCVDSVSTEFDLEFGRVDPASQVPTPR